jgi:transcriptional regulator with XRE-family HTH domain
VTAESDMPGTIQRSVVSIKDNLLDAVRLFVGQLAAVDDDPHTTAEARRLFAAALREARLRYGKETGQGKITQKQFAKMLGISGERPEERYRLYEKAEREPPLWVLAALRRVTGYSLDDLIAQLPAGRPLGWEQSRVSPRRSSPRPKGPDPPRPTLRGGGGGNRASADCPRVVRLER